MSRYKDIIRKLRIFWKMAFFVHNHNILIFQNKSMQDNETWFPFIGQPCLQSSLFFQFMEEEMCPLTQWIGICQLHLFNKLLSKMYWYQRNKNSMQIWKLCVHWRNDCMMAALQFHMHRFDKTFIQFSKFEICPKVPSVKWSIST